MRMLGRRGGVGMVLTCEGERGLLGWSAEASSVQVADFTGVSSKRAGLPEVSASEKIWSPFVGKPTEAGPDEGVFIPSNHTRGLSQGRGLSPTNQESPPKLDAIRCGSICNRRDVVRLDQVPICRIQTPFGSTPTPIASAQGFTSDPPPTDRPTQKSCAR